MHLLTHILLFSQRKKWFAIHSSSLSVPVFPLLSQCHTLLISLYVTRAQNQLRREASWSWLPAARGTAQQLCWPETETFCKEGVDAGDVSDRFILSNSNKEGAFFFFFTLLFSDVFLPVITILLLSWMVLYTYRINFRSVHAFIKPKYRVLSVDRSVKETVNNVICLQKMLKRFIFTTWKKQKP